MNEERSSSTRKILISLLVLTLILSLCIPLISTSTSGQVVVGRTPPTFINITIGDGGEELVLDIVVNDWNGRHDIYRMDAMVTDENWDILSHISYQQHSDNETYDYRDSFSDESGNFLEENRCTVEDYEEGTWALYDSGLRIRFVLEPFSGKYVNMTITDMTGEVGNYFGPFSSEYEPPPMIEDPVMRAIIPIGLSMIIAIISALFITLRRHYSNKLATRVAAYEKRHGET